MFASCFDKVEWFYDCYKGFINKLYTGLRFLCLILNVLIVQNFMKIFVSFFLTRLSDFSQECNFLYTIQYKFLSWLSICFKITGSHHTLNIIAICKTHMAIEPIYRTYCGVYPLSPDFQTFSLLISLSEIGTKDKEERIKLHVLLDFFIFST